jgi:hypothetical protein
MKIHKSSLKLLAVLAATAAVAGAWAPVFGSSLVSIGVLDPTDITTAYSEIRAVSQDGAYVVGTSLPVGGTLRVPIIWSAADGLVALPSPSSGDAIGIGVAVGVGGNAGNICIAGLHEGNLTHRYYIAPLNNLTSGSWVDCASAGGWPTSDLRGGLYNDLRNAAQVAGWPPLGNWYTGSKRQNGRDARLRGDLNINGWDGATIQTNSSISAYGVMVGTSSDSPSAAFYEVVNVGFYTVPNSSGSTADGFGISSSFGIDAAGTYDVQWISGQVNSYNGGAQMEGFRWKLGDADMTFLGSLAPAGGGDAGDNSACAYTVADNGVTAGASFFGAVGATPSYEVATVWDTSGTWDSTGTAKSVEALLAADGVNISAWTHLTRVYAASDDGKVLAGYGTWAADSSTRGFVATKSAAAAVVRITKISWSSPNVVIDFTSSNLADTTAKFTLQQAGTLVNTATVFGNVSPAATITGSAGSFQATFSPTANPQFYRINRLP